MDELARELKNEFQRNWRLKNPEKVKKANVDYWKRKADKKRLQLLEVKANG